MVVWYLVYDYSEIFISPILKDNLPDMIIMVGRCLLSGLKIPNSVVLVFCLLFWLFFIPCFIAVRASVTVIFLTSLLLILPIVFHLICCAFNSWHLLVFQHLNYFSSNVHCWVSYLSLDSFTSFIWLFGSSL